MLQFLACEYGPDSQEQLLLKFDSNVVRTGEDVYFLYRWHCTEFSDSLRPAFPSQVLLLDEPIEDIEREFRYFWRLFTGLCGTSVSSHEFFSPSSKRLTHPKDLDLAQQDQLPPLYEWLPATSHFIRSTWSRLRRRSPSPHLEINEADRQESVFAAEKRESIQRIRVREIQNSYQKHRIEQIDQETLDKLADFSFPEIDMKTLDERHYLLKNTIESLQSAVSSVKKTESLLESMIIDFNADDCSESESGEASSSIGAGDSCETIAEDGEFCFPAFVGFELIDAAQGKLIRLRHFDNSVHESLIGPLQWQLNDLHCIMEPINRRTELLRKLARLVDLRSDALKALESAPPHKASAKQEKVDKIGNEISNLTDKISALSANLHAQLPRWLELSTSFLLSELDKFKGSK